MSTYNCRGVINGIIVQNNPVNRIDPDGENDFWIQVWNAVTYAGNTYAPYVVEHGGNTVDLILDVSDAINYPIDYAFDYVIDTTFEAADYSINDLYIPGVQYGYDKFWEFTHPQDVDQDPNSQWELDYPLIPAAYIPFKKEGC